MPPDTAALVRALAASAVRPLSDADAAALLSTPTRTPHIYRVTFGTLAEDVSTARALAFKATLRALVTQGGANGVMADFVIGVLDGAGANPASAETAAMLAQLVGAGLLTAAEGDAAVYTLTYPAGAPVAAGDVTAARVVLARNDALDAVGALARDVYATWMNERVNPAYADAGLPVPTAAEFVTLAQSKAGG